MNFAKMVEALISVDRAKYPLNSYLLEIIGTPQP